MIRKFFHFLFLTLLSHQLIAEEKVVLQLKWEHEFQFAGYYAAKWQGYYKDEGLNVEIKTAAQKDKQLLQPSVELRKGNAQFAIGALDILKTNRSEIQPLILSPIFQKSPSAIFSLQHVDISSLKKLSKLKIATYNAGAIKTELLALFRSHGFSLDKLNFVEAPPTIDTLLEGKADAIITFIVSARFFSKEKGIELNMLSPSEYGVEFYGDTLYTTQTYANNNPDIVRKFIRASKKGWKYALENKEEIAKRISAELPRYIVNYENLLGYNLAFADTIDSLLDYPNTPIGKLDQNKWLNMNERMRSIGLIQTHLNNNNFYNESKTQRLINKQPYIFFLTIAISFPIIFLLWYRKKRILTVAAILLTTLLLEYQAESYFVEKQGEADNSKIERALRSVSDKLQSDLQSNLSMLTGFAAYISATPDLSYDDYSRYASQLFRKSHMLISFSAAKDLVINYVYPLEVNQKAIGLDYRKTPSQIDMVLQVVNTRQMLVVDPVDLVQGGRAFIARVPIFLEDGSLWGIISAPIDQEKLFRFSGIENFSQEAEVAIKSYDTLGNQGEVFFGDASIFDKEEHLQSIISVGGGSWYIAALYKNIDGTTPDNIYILRIYFFFAGLLISVFAWFRFRQESEKSRLESEIRAEKILLESVGKVAKISGWKLNDNLEFIKWSSQASLLLGKDENYKPKSLSELEPFFLFDDYQLLLSESKLAIENSSPFDIELKLSSNQFGTRWLKFMSDGIRKTNSLITGTIQDVTNKVISAKLIEHQASYDNLTGLPNRTLYRDRLVTSIKNAHRNKQKIAVLFIDLDRFKPINDNHGHQIGDKVLIEAARRIKSCVRKSDTVSRLSGDEFAVILNDVPQYNHVLKVTDHIIETMQETYRIENAAVYSSASIGIALYPNDADDADSLLRKADQAMYEVKASGRNGSQFYTKEMQLKSEYRHEMLNELILAVNNQNLEAYYQPIFDLKDKKMVRCESLARWQKSNGEFVPPVDFIDLAEESGLINRIDLFMLQEAANTLQDLPQDIDLSINISPRLFMTKDKALENWITNIQRISQKLSITVEITERLLTDDSELALIVLEQLKSFGVKIAIDDFGTGYSSLSYLVKYPVDVIKIDRSFVKDIGIKSSAGALIETILAMANRLSIKVVAEGIETQAQLKYLKLHGCDYGQGYYLARPMDKESFIAFSNQN